MEEASELLSEHLVAAARRAAGSRGRFLLALSGGSTPRTLYRRLAEGAMGSRIPWERVWVLFGDERLVAPDRPESNFRMARETLLDHVPIPKEQVLRVRGELEPASEAVRDYEERLAHLLGTSGARLDLVLLGVGEDGHTASLFPSSPELDVQESRVALVVRSPEPPLLPRATLTLPVICSAEEVCFLVAGPEKAAIMRAVLESLPDGTPRLPSSLVLSRGTAHIYLDAAAAAQLPRTFPGGSRLP